MSHDILVIAVHPDDETLGAGGTLLKHKENGDRIHWLIITSMTEEKGYSQKQIEKRNFEITAVAKDYGFSSVSELKLPTTCLDELSDSTIIDYISKVFKEIKPHTVYLPFYNDVHSDHRKTFDAVFSCTKSFRYPFVKKVLMMETLSETDFAPALSHLAFVPNVYVDIGKFIEKKCEILKRFEGEIAPAPFPRSLETVRGLATFRGSVAGCLHAEAFVLLKEIL
ncbi:MAG: PIG-L family deacetylase [Bacteriovorax sp.]|nr:PIG-L family deacetylase [Bacteriovorax sp.]